MLSRLPTTNSILKKSRTMLKQEQALNRAQSRLHNALMLCLQRNGSQAEIDELNEAQREINYVRAELEEKE